MTSLQSASMWVSMMTLRPLKEAYDTGAYKTYVLDIGRIHHRLHLAYSQSRRHLRRRLSSRHIYGQAVDG